MEEVDGRMTPWEQWVVRKAKEDQVKVQREMERRKKDREERERKEQVRIDRWWEQVKIDR